MAAQRQLPAADAHKDSQPGLPLIPSLWISVLQEGGTSLQLSSRGQQGFVVWACSLLALWPSQTQEEDTEAAVTQPALPLRSALRPSSLPSAAAHCSALLWPGLAEVCSSSADLPVLAMSAVPV